MVVGTKAANAARNKQTEAHLRMQMEALKDELREAMAEGNSSEAFRLRQMLDAMPTAIKSAMISDLKEVLAEAESKLAEMEQEQKDLQELKDNRERIWHERLKAADDARGDVKEVQMAIFACDAKVQTARRYVRAYQQRLKKHLRELEDDKRL